MKTDLFQPCGHCWALQISWHIECSTFTASSFGIWNSSTGIPSPPLALFVVMFLSAHLAFHSRMSGSRWVITPLWLSGSWRSLANHFTALRTPWINHLYYLSKWTIPLYQESESESEVTQSCPTLWDPWTVVHQTPLSMGFSRQEYWSGLPFPSPGDLPEPDNQNGVITHLEPDILECQVKWALGSITRNKASGGDGIHLQS